MKEKSQSSVGIVILGAGLGKRMRSSLPKVLHEVSGSPMLFHILSGVKKASPHASIAIVVGYGREQVEAAVLGNSDFSDLDISFIHQVEQRGTGHAARCAINSEWGQRLIAIKAPILVLPGDLPLLPTQLIEQMLEPLGRVSAMRLLTCELSHPFGYGRVVRRGKSGPVLRIVEQNDANEREKQIREVAVSIYLFRSAFLKSGLQKLSNKNAQGEYYLTDLVAQAARASQAQVEVLQWPHSEDLRGVNDPWELAQASQIFNQRILKSWGALGVKWDDPSATWVDITVQFQGAARVGPGTVLRGKTLIGEGAVIGPHVVLQDMVIGNHATIKAGTVGESSEVSDHAQVGPYAHLRPDSHVGVGAKIGNFVELKKTRIGERTSVAHLSYLGDADVGRYVNIGCGFVTCNFDGRVIEGQRKHKTVIEDEAFIGSDCQAIAPVRIGQGAYVASGSTITDNVESDSLAIARSRQVNKPGYARKLRVKE